MWLRLLGAALLAGCASGGALPGDEDGVDPGGSGGMGGGGTDAAILGAVDAQSDAAGPGGSSADGPAVSTPDARPPDAAPCIGGVTNPTNGHCYFYFDGRVQWDEAAASCAGMGAYLVSMTD